MGDYTGKDNLESMARAIKYNTYLCALVEEFALEDDCALDFGAGIGTIAKRLRRRGLRVECVEPDAQQFQILRESEFTAYSDVSHVPDAKFDFAYSLNVLEHIDDDVKALQVLHAKLKPGGRLLVYVPAFQLLYSSMDKKVGHLRRYGRRDLIDRLTAAGFNVHQARYCDSIGFFASLIYKWIGDEAGGINLRALVAYDRFVFPLSRIVDFVVSRWFGKNVLAVAIKGMN